MQTKVPGKCGSQINPVTRGSHHLHPRGSVALRVWDIADISCVSGATFSQITLIQIGIRINAVSM